MSKMQRTFGTLAAFAIASQMSEAPIIDREIIYEKPKHPDWERKKCKSCKSFSMCGKRPLANACELYQKRK